MIVWLASFPRSGNTFARRVLHGCLGLRTACVYEGNDYVARRLGEDWVGQDPRPMAEVRADPAPVLTKTHRREPGDAPAIYLVRDGRACLRSWAELRAGDEAETVDEAFAWLLARRGTQTGSWGASVIHWTDRPRTVVVPYHRLIADPVQVLAAALASVGIAATPNGEAPPSFDALKARDPAFFSSGPSRWIPDDVRAGFAADPINGRALQRSLDHGWIPVDPRGTTTVTGPTGSPPSDAAGHATPPEGPGEFLR